MTLTLLLPGTARAAGDAAQGHALARVWCTSCHMVEADAISTSTDSAPPFVEIAQRGSPAQSEARGFIAAPHPPMPNFDLSRQQIEDIVAYLNSLARP